MKRLKKSFATVYNETVENLVFHVNFIQIDYYSTSMCECVVDGFSHPDKCPIDFSESGHLSFKEQVLAPSLVFGRGPTTIKYFKELG